MNIADNYDDVRLRFFQNVESFRKLAKISSQEVLTFIIDRAIYSQEVFDYIVEINNLIIITWEKNYNNDKWSNSDVTKCGSIKRKGNNWGVHN